MHEFQSEDFTIADHMIEVVKNLLHENTIGSKYQAGNNAIRILLERVFAKCWSAGPGEGQIGARLVRIHGTRGGNKGKTLFWSRTGHVMIRMFKITKNRFL